MCDSFVEVEFVDFTTVDFMFHKKSRNLNKRSGLFIFFDFMLRKEVILSYFYDSTFLAEGIGFEKWGDFCFCLFKTAIDIVVKCRFALAFIETIEQNCIFEEIENLIVHFVDVAVLVDMIWEVGSVEIEGETLEFSDFLFKIFSGEF